MLKFTRKADVTYLGLFLTIAMAGVLRFSEPAQWPVFLDESICIINVLEMSARGWPDCLLVPASNSGKPPLVYLSQWGVANWVGDPLIAGRLLSAGAGVASTLLCFFLSRPLVGSSGGLLTAAAYAVSPLAVLHERMALQDGLMSTFALAAFLAMRGAIHRRSLALAIAGALLGAGAVQMKTPGLATAAAPLILLFSRFVSGMAVKDRLVLAVVSCLGPLVSFTALVVSPLGPGVLRQNAERTKLFSNLLVNVGHLQDAFLTYFPAGMAFFVLAGLILAFRERRQEGLALVVMILVWTVPWLILSNFAPSRYYLPAVPFAYALATIAVFRFAEKARSRHRLGLKLVAAMTLIVLVASGVDSAKLVTAHHSAALSKLDDWQYRSGWPSGYAYAEAAAFLDEVTSPDSAVAYVVDPQHRVGVGYYRPLRSGARRLGLFKPTDQLPREESDLFIVVDDTRRTKPGQRLEQLLANEPRLEVLARFPRLGSEEALYVLRLAVSHD